MRAIGAADPIRPLGSAAQPVRAETSKEPIISSSFQSIIQTRGRCSGQPPEAAPADLRAAIDKLGK
jgi:hypothetical protein